MTNYSNGPTTDHCGVVFDYNGLVLDRAAPFVTSYGISESPSINHNGPQRRCLLPQWHCEFATV